MPADVRFQQTPNPNAGKFSTGRAVVAGKASRSYYSAAQAAGDPLAERLFQLDGVASLFMVDDFVTVTKQPDAQWQVLAPRVVDVMQRALG
jgi:hypothetical protein